jgi:hypothetical protein
MAPLHLTGFNLKTIMSPLKKVRVKAPVKILLEVLNLREDSVDTTFFQWGQLYKLKFFSFGDLAIILSKGFPI